MKLKDLKEQKKEKFSIDIKPLDYKETDLDPVMTKENVDYHYNDHTKGYAKKAKEKGDSFNVNGARLHNIWWEQFQKPLPNNRPTEKIEDWIKENFKSFEELKKEITGEAMKLQGSGWVAVMKDGKIKQIPNHNSVGNIVLLIDMWEHAYYPTYGPEKSKYLENIWRIIDWDKISERV